jgi:hypothetical protein
MADSVPPPGVDKRVRYFNGEFLQEKEFTVEQAYQLDREHRQNRLLHGPGIAEGLTVTSGAPNKVTVGWGTAIDAEGRQLVRLAASDFPLSGEKFNDKQGVELYLSYKEEPSDIQDDPGGIRDDTRWHEVPELTAVPPGGTYPGTEPPVLLARLSLDGKGDVTVDNSERSYTGARLPGPAADAPALRSLSSGRVVLTRPLTIDGSAAAGEAQPALHVKVPALTPPAPPTPVCALQLDVATFGTLDNATASQFLLVRDTGLKPLKTYFAIRGDGSVGVGTSSPGAKLHVAGAGGQNVDLLVSGRLRSESNDGGLWVAADRFVGGLNTNQIGIFNGGSFRLVVLNNGNIGIGTDKPENSENWSKVVDVVGGGNAKLSLRTPDIDARVQANNWNDTWKSPPGMMVGTKSAHPLSFGTGGASRMTVSSVGLVGIGTTDPGSILHLYTIGSPALNPKPVQAMRIDVKSFGSADNRRQSYYVLAQDVDGGQEFFAVRGDGSVGIGTGDPGQQKLRVAGSTWIQGDLFVSGNIVFRLNADGRRGQTFRRETIGNMGWEEANGPSDIRLKTEVRLVSDALGRVRELRGIRFRWSEAGLDYLTRDAAASVSAGPGATDEQNREVGLAEQRRVREALAGDRMGLVAQELEAVAPELVFHDEDGYKHIRYQQLTALLVEAVKEQDVRVRSLSAKVAALQRKNPGRAARQPEGE